MIDSVNATNEFPVIASEFPIIALQNCAKKSVWNREKQEIYDRHFLFPLIRPLINGYLEGKAEPFKQLFSTNQRPSIQQVEEFIELNRNLCKEQNLKQRFFRQVRNMFRSRADIHDDLMKAHRVLHMAMIAQSTPSAELIKRHRMLALQIDNIESGMPLAIQSKRDQLCKFMAAKLDTANWGDVLLHTFCAVIHSSAKIEDIVVTSLDNFYGMMRDGQIPIAWASSNEKKDPKAMYNLNRAYYEILSRVDDVDHQEINLQFVIEIHRLIVRDLPEGDPQCYPENQTNLISILEWINNEWKKEPKQVDPVTLAAIAHISIVSCHPFKDGNGRTSRAIQDFILLSCGFPPAHIDNTWPYIEKVNRCLGYRIQCEVECGKGLGDFPRGCHKPLFLPEYRVFIRFLFDSLERTIDRMLNFNVGKYQRGINRVFDGAANLPPICAVPPLLRFDQDLHSPPYDPNSSDSGAADLSHSSCPANASILNTTDGLNEPTASTGISSPAPVNITNNGIDREHIGWGYLFQLAFTKNWSPELVKFLRGDYDE